MVPSSRRLRHVLRLLRAVATRVCLKAQNLLHTRLHRNRQGQSSVAPLCFLVLSCSKQDCHWLRPINETVLRGSRSHCPLERVASRHALKDSLRVHDDDDECISCFLLCYFFDKKTS